MSDKKRFRLGSVWAQDQNRVIGSGTGMLWRVPADQQFFKETTLNAPIVMGRPSWEALKGPLPNRTNIVITRAEDYRADGAIVTHSLAEAIEAAEADATERGTDRIWIGGGAHVYRQTMDLVDELFITQLDLTVAGDPDQLARAPLPDPAVWRLDPTRSDNTWRERSGDARWKVEVYVRRTDNG